MKRYLGRSTDSRPGSIKANEGEMTEIAKVQSSSGKLNDSLNLASAAIDGALERLEKAVAETVKHSESIIRIAEAIEAGNSALGERIKPAAVSE